MHGWCSRLWTDSMSFQVAPIIAKTVIVQSFQSWPIISKTDHFPFRVQDIRILLVSWLLNQEVANWRDVSRCKAVLEWVSVTKHSCNMPTTCRCANANAKCFVLFVTTLHVTGLTEGLPSFAPTSRTHESRIRCRDDATDAAAHPAESSIGDAPAKAGYLNTLISAPYAVITLSVWYV